jgi:uncharacterized protein (DUF302 family)
VVPDAVTHGSIGMSVTVEMSMQDAEEAIRAALGDVGFGVLTEIDVAATLKAKLDIDRSAYKILGACNPTFANEALKHNEQIGLLLPCNVTLSDNGSTTTISAVDPTLLLAAANQDGAMDELASAARTMLQQALEAVAD